MASNKEILRQLGFNTGDDFISRIKEEEAKIRRDIAEKEAGISKKPQVSKAKSTGNGRSK